MSHAATLKELERIRESLTGGKASSTDAETKKSEPWRPKKPWGKSRSGDSKSTRPAKEGSEPWRPPSLSGKPRWSDSSSRSPKRKGQWRKEKLPSEGETDLIYNLIVAKIRLKLGGRTPTTTHPILVTISLEDDLEKIEQKILNDCLVEHKLFVSFIKKVRVCTFDLIVCPHLSMEDRLHTRFANDKHFKNTARLYGMVNAQLVRYLPHKLERLEIEWDGRIPLFDTDLLRRLVAEKPHHLKITNFDTKSGKIILDLEPIAE